MLITCGELSALFLDCFSQSIARAMTIFDVVAEHKIQEAIQRGQLDQPALHGVPIAIDDDFSVSAEVRFVLKRLTQVAPGAGDHSPLVAFWNARRYKALIRQRDGSQGSDACGSGQAPNFPL